MVALGVNLSFLRLSRVTLEYQQGIIIIVCQLCCFPCQQVMSYVAAPSCYYLWLSSQSWHHAESVYNSHNGKVGLLASSTNIHRYNIAVRHLQTVRVLPYLQNFAIANHLYQVCALDGFVALMRIAYDVADKYRLPLS